MFTFFLSSSDFRMLHFLKLRFHSITYLISSLQPFTFCIVSRKYIFKWQLFLVDTDSSLSLSLWRPMAATPTGLIPSQLTASLPPNSWQPSGKNTPPHPPTYPDLPPRPTPQPTQTSHPTRGVFLLWWCQARDLWNESYNYDVDFSSVFLHLSSTLKLFL